MADEKPFLSLPRRELPKRSASERKGDFKEFTQAFSDPVFKEQGRRCMDCGVPFCQGDTGCPVQNLIPEWNTLVAQGDWKSALARLHATNNFPEFTGKLCPAPCESACVLGVTADPVSIKGIELSIIDRGFSEGWVHPLKAKRSTGHRVAIVGSGPAGLAAAQELARRGHDVFVFEKADSIGGLLRYGIPDFKFEKHLIDRRIRQMEEEGVRFRTGVCIGRDISFESLQEDFDAVCLAIGAERPRDLTIPGRDLEGVHFAMDFLIQQNQAVSGLGPSPSRLHAGGKKVIILGGGDTGSDCLGTALRQGAADVLQFELMPEPPAKRAEQTPWPYWPLQLRVSHAHEEGGRRQWSFATERFEGDNGKLKRLVGHRLDWKDGRPSAIGTPHHFEADLVILALGFLGPEPSPLLKETKVRLDAQGRVAIDKNYMTSREGVFAAGDVHRGASLIVWAIAEGRKMAKSVNAYLSNHRSHELTNYIKTEEHA